MRDKKPAKKRLYGVLGLTPIEDDLLRIKVKGSETTKSMHPFNIADELYTPKAEQTRNLSLFRKTLKMMDSEIAENQRIANKLRRVSPQRTSIRDPA